jgi:hypothetical protein
MRKITCVHKDKNLSRILANAMRFTRQGLKPGLLLVLDVAAEAATHKSYSQVGLK